MTHANKERVTLGEAIATSSVESHTFRANLPLDHCYGSPEGPVAHGGLIASIIVSATQQHFRSTLRNYNHPDTFDVSINFLRPATAGSAVVVIRDIKLGGAASTIHFTLMQNEKERAVGYAVNANLISASGISLPTPKVLSPEPPPINFGKAAAEGSDANWVGFVIPWHPDSFLKPVTHFQFFSQINAPEHKSITQVWMRCNSQYERFTTEMLGSVADHWHRMPENYLPKSKWNNMQMAANALQAATAGTQIQGYSTSYGYPTLSMQLEIKKSLPPQGVEWLFLRAQTTEIKNGRFDATITIMDENLELIALSHQVCFVVKSLQIPDKKKKSLQEGKL